MAVWKINFILVSLSLQCFSHSIPNVQVGEAVQINNAQNQNYASDANTPVAVHNANVQGIPGYQKIEDAPTAYAGQQHINPQDHQKLTQINAPLTQKIENFQKTHASSLQSAQRHVINNRNRNNLPRNLNITSADHHEIQHHNQFGDDQIHIVEGETITIFQLLEELLEDEDFWDFLSMWTEAYTAVLDEHINAAVQEEVSKQIKQYLQNNEVIYVGSDETDEYDKYNKEGDEENKLKSNNIKTNNFNKHQYRPHESNNKHNDKNKLIKEHNIYNSTFGNDYTTNIYIISYNKENTTSDTAEGAGLDIRVGVPDEIIINEQDSNNENANGRTNSFANKAVLDNIKSNVDKIKSNENNESRGNLKSLLLKEYKK